MRLSQSLLKAKAISSIFALLILVAFLCVQINAAAQSGVPLRRPVSPAQPMWLIHIDSWNNADPQKIIDMVPKDIRPFVVFNISLSIGHDSTGKWSQIEYGYETIKSWLRVCAQNRVWAMIQQSSGGFAHFSDFDLSVYEELYRDYPCLIGFNYAEQFWGYDDPYSVSWTQRMAHFTDLLKLSNRFGGYLTVSWCGNEYSPNINPMAMMKRNPDFANACKLYSRNFILCEKYTTQAYKLDMESLCLGSYLSGFSGNYGIRYDQSGWSDSTGANDNFTMATAVAPYLEHIMLTGETVIDGPELIFDQQSKEITASTTKDGYTSRQWQFFPQLYNVTMDVFRKVLDGTLRIPTRQEVIDRTKIAIIHDVNTGSNDDVYSTPKTLFEGLYQMDNDGVYQNNKSFYKKTGRYPTIPVIYGPADAIGNSFAIKVNNSTYSARWPTIMDKVNELNDLFPKEYTGDLYVGRNENNWIVYNPYKTNKVAAASIPFKYNTCDSMNLSFSQYSSGVVKESPGQLKVYLNNYDNMIDMGLKTDIIAVYGCSSQPSWSYKDRSDHQASSLSSKWVAGVFILTVKHNGPTDVTINCSGSASDRLTSYHVASIHAPELPAIYAGPQQYEAEFFEYKNITENVSNGVKDTIRNYTGEGYLLFGTNSAASVKTLVNAPHPGDYLLQIKYSAAGGNVNAVDLIVNGVKVSSPIFVQTTSSSNWNVVNQPISLNAGTNTVTLSANTMLPNEINFDNIVLLPMNGGQYTFDSDTARLKPSTPPGWGVSLKDGTAGVTSYTDGNDLKTNVFKSYSNGSINGTGVADLDLFVGAGDYSVTWKEYIGASGAKKGILLRGSGECAYAKGMKQGYLFVTENNSDNTVTLRPYIAKAIGIFAEPSYTSPFSVELNKPVWYRATANGNILRFECSIDSINWVGASSTTFIDNTYGGGKTQLIWGMGSIGNTWMLDNIDFQSSTLLINKLKLARFSYVEGQGPSLGQSLLLTGRSLKSDVLVEAPQNFEVSLDSLSGYGQNLSIPRIVDSIASTKFFVRLKEGMPSDRYNGELIISGSGDSVLVPLEGGVSLSKIYTFSDDAATTSPQNPPAVGVSIGTGNGVTAGVISYVDVQSKTDNYLKVYGVGASGNATAVLNLDLFPSNSSDYSVTWKQSVPDSTKQYKNGMLLRGTGIAGYTEGIMQGYLFNASNSSPSNIAFRIFKSTTSGIGSPLASTNVNSNLHLSNNKPIWFRASVTGKSPVLLRFEYSTDSINWYTGTTYNDNANSFTEGATQIVSGLFASGNEYYLDNITLDALPEDAQLTVMESSPGSYRYKQGDGPSLNHGFLVKGLNLKDDIVVKAPSTFEITLDTTSAYSSTIRLEQIAGVLDSTTVYARLKTGLTKGDYDGKVTFSYAQEPSAFADFVVLRGEVLQPKISLMKISAMDDMGYVLPYGNSIVRAFNVAGSFLSSNLNIIAPSGFELSLNSGTGYMTSISISPVRDSVLPTIIYIRVSPGLAAGQYSGHVVISSAGAENKELSVNSVVTNSGNISSSETALSGLGYSTYANIPPIRSFIVCGKPLADPIDVVAPANFEISRTLNEGYGATVNLGIDNGSIDSTIIYIRLKAGLAEGYYSGKVSILSSMASGATIDVEGVVSSSLVYDFTSDAQSNGPVNPPALNMVVGVGNTASAGVVNYTYNGSTEFVSNSFRAYSGGNRNATGVIDLNLFPEKSTDYSVTWKEALGSENTDYKVGMLLRGGNVAGLDGSSGYVQGIKEGYLFIVYTAGSGTNKHSEFRIYRSTTSTNLALLINNNSVTSLVPTNGQPIWYRASVSGDAAVDLKFEYSTDSINWNIGAQTTDATSIFTSGSTQLVWGLAASNYNFYIDDISYNSASSSTLPVGIASFMAKNSGKEIRLDWNAENNAETKEFKIEKSIDGVGFSEIGAVFSKNVSTDYHFTDISPVKGNNYYRIKQVNKDGSYFYSMTRSVSYSLNGSIVAIFPNPVKNILNIHSSMDGGNLSIYNTQGVLMLQKVVVPFIKNSLDVSRLPAGLYLYKLNNKKGSFIKK